MRRLAPFGRAVISVDIAFLALADLEREPDIVAGERVEAVAGRAGGDAAGEEQKCQDQGDRVSCGDAPARRCHPLVTPVSTWQARSVDELRGEPETRLAGAIGKEAWADSKRRPQEQFSTATSSNRCEAYIMVLPENRRLEGWMRIPRSFVPGCEKIHVPVRNERSWFFSISRLLWRVCCYYRWRFVPE